MTDSEIVSRLIFLAFVAEPAEPVPFGPDSKPLLTWGEAMGLYARCIERERSPQGLHVHCTAAPEVLDFARRLNEKAEAETANLLNAEPPSEMQPGPDDAAPAKPGLVLDPPPIFPDKPNPLEGFVPLRAKEIKGELSTVPHFTGKGATDKREIFDRMNAFRDKHRLQAFKTAAEASDGKLTEWEIRDMMECKPAPMTKWHALRDALDRLEGS